VSTETDEQYELEIRRLEKLLEKRSVELYEVNKEQSNKSVIKNRAIYTLRVIAGLIESDPIAERNPRDVALQFLKNNGLLTK